MYLWLQAGVANIRADSIVVPAMAEDSRWHKPEQCQVCYTIEFGNEGTDVSAPVYHGEYYCFC